MVVEVDEGFVFLSFSARRLAHGAGECVLPFARWLLQGGFDERP